MSFSPLFVNTAIASALKCSSIFAQTNLVTMDQITQVIQELSALRLNLDQAQAQGARSITFGFLQKEFDQKYLALVSYVEKNQIMTRAELVERLQQEIARLQQETIKKENDESPLKESQIRHLQAIGDRHTGYKMTPQKVEAGTFTNSRGGTVVITKPFEMMSTTTTQIVWRKVVDLLDQNFPHEYDLSLDPSFYKDDLNPVMNISFNDVEFWLWGLNQLSQKGESALADIIEGHQAGDHYRLPRQNEWEYVLRGEDRAMVESNLDKYAWMKSRHPHHVGLKLPILKDGKEFYDLLGNVNEIVDDYNFSGPGMSQDKKPKRNLSHYTISTLGGNFTSDGSQVFGDFAVSINNKEGFIGFRMVRDVMAPAPIQPQISQQAPVQAAPPAAPQKTSLWKKITGKLGW